MRTGDFKQTYGELVTLVDSRPVWLWSAVLVMGLIAAPFVLNSYALKLCGVDRDTPDPSGGQVQRDVHGATVGREAV